MLGVNTLTPFPPLPKLKDKRMGEGGHQYRLYVLINLFIQEFRKDPTLEE